MTKYNIDIAHLLPLNRQNGHLKSNYRIGLLKAIVDTNTINKIFLACSIKVYPFWEKAFPDDDTVYKMLSQVDAYLYEGVKTDFISLADSYKGYLEGIFSLQASAAGLSALSLCYSVGYNAAGVLNDESKGEDDDILDWETWGPDFYASMAFAGGNPFLGEGNPTLRSEFWKWYLQCIQEIHAVPERRLLPLTPKPATTLEGSIFLRSQNSNTPDIRSKVEAVIAATKQDLVKQFPTSVWTRLNIEVVCMASGVNLKANFSTNTQPNVQPIKLTYYLQSGDKSSAHLMSAVKRTMYEQAPGEGAWMQCLIVVQSSGSWTIDFNYDEVDHLPESKKAPDYLLLEFQKFPRSEQFTPDWWKAIVQNKVSYYK